MDTNTETITTHGDMQVQSFIRADGRLVVNVMRWNDARRCWERADNGPTVY